MKNDTEFEAGLICHFKNDIKTFHLDHLKLVSKFAL